MKLDNIDIRQVLWALFMFKRFYLEDKYNDNYSYKQRIEEAHWYLDYANGILDRAIKGITYTTKSDDINSDQTIDELNRERIWEGLEPFMETYK